MNKDNKPGQPAKTKLGSGNYKDGKKYTAEDHYIAWVKFWKEYIAERARYGFFIEHNSGGYMYHSNRIIYDIYAWCEDEALRTQVRMWMDLIWAQWAQDQTLLIQGGATSRGYPGPGRMGGMAEYFLGGPANQGHFYVLSDYQWPRQVWEMMLDRPGMGEYAFISRKPGEGRDEWPREPGSEYTMLVRHDSRMNRYSWCTPDYVMGLRQDHPDALYHHLGGASAGITFPTSPDATLLFPVSGWNTAVQDRGVALMQSKRAPRMRHPEWFPGYAPGLLVKLYPDLRMGFSHALDRIEEKDGWVFVQEGKAYVAVRIVMQAKGEDGKLSAPDHYDNDGFGIYKPDPMPYTWVEDKKLGRSIMVPDPYAPVIVEASRQAHYPTLEAFMEDVLDNPVILKQIIGDTYILEYRGCGKEAKTLTLNVANNSTPRIDGKYLDYNCPTFDSPTLQGEFGSGVVTLTGPISGEKLVLDFNEVCK